MKPLAQRLNRMTASQSIAVTTRAWELKNKGIDIISMSSGEPDFDTPDHIKTAAVNAINSGYTKYCSAAGYSDLINAISNKFRNENDLEYKPEQIVVSSGAKQSIFNIIMSLCEEGDEVIIPLPSWVTYPELVKCTEATPVTVKCTYENGFKMTGKQFEQAITPRTKLMVFNTPGNPTGAVYTQKELEDIANIAIRNDIYVLSDEVYEKIVYDDYKHISIGSLDREIYNRTITVNGVSKAFAMTGWRIGYMGAPEEIADAVIKFQGQSTHHPSTISMKAAKEALNGHGNSIKEMVTEYLRRRNFVMERLEAIPQLSCRKPEGAFYAFPDISAYYGKSYHENIMKNSLDLCSYLLNEEQLALVPGSAFGEDSCIRISFAVCMNDIKKGLDRLEEGLAKLE